MTEASPASVTLPLVLALLGTAVLAVALFRLIKLPSPMGYLLAGMLIGPHALGWVPAGSQTHRLAEFGVVFLMFSIGLEFSLPRLLAMKTVVVGLGGAQVMTILLLVVAISPLLGVGVTAAIALGGAAAMSSTAIVAKVLAERLELQSPHGRQIIGVLLFQDLAVVPLLILLPVLAHRTPWPAADLGWAALKAGAALVLLLVLGQRLMRPWFQFIARQRSSEIFMLNILLVTLGLAYLTESAGLSLALGAFLAGMLISETEYRYQVEDDIKPFRDVLLGLFFVGIGMLLEPRMVLEHIGVVLLALVIFVFIKVAAGAGLAVLFGNELPVAMRTGLGLAQGGEFGFVLLYQAGRLHVLAPGLLQLSLAVMLLSMLAAPFMVQNADLIVRWCCGGEWLGRARELHEVAVRSFGVEGHVIICGYGRSGQNLARLLEQEDIPFVALDLDPQRVREASAAGESVVYGDAARREVLIAAGLRRARALVVSYADVRSAMRILHHVQELRPDLAVVVRTLDDAELPALVSAGATEVVPEVMEGSLTLASHALMLLGVPLARVLSRVREVRSQRYGLFRGFYRGTTDATLEQSEAAQPRLQTVWLPEGAAAVGKTLSEIDLEAFMVEPIAIRRRHIRGFDPQPDTRLMVGDVLVLRGTRDNLAAAEIRLVQG
ncbi:MAG: monovalent cation:proton antiporter-2 (CPA2) family protein [Betaproteobacteria bacterium]|nr:monovalent cation:proton antiporter-2 (CPA2) family protein [Betaproteobacteria bacterium]